MTEQTATSSTSWHSLSAEDVARQLQVEPAKGLAAAEAKTRLERYGANQLAAKKKEPGWQAFLRQYKDFMQIILFGAAVVNQIFTQDWNTTLLLIGLTVTCLVVAYSAWVWRLALAETKASAGSAGSTGTSDDAGGLARTPGA